MSFLKSYCFLLAPLSKWCFYSYLAFHCQANFPRCLFFHTLPCSKATSGSLLCLIPIPPHSGFPTINVVHSAPSLSLFHKQRRKNSHGLPSLRGTRMIDQCMYKNMGVWVLEAYFCSRFNSYNDRDFWKPLTELVESSQLRSDDGVGSRWEQEIETRGRKGPGPA